MSYIDISRRSINSAHETTVCITKDECKILLPFIEKIHRDIKVKHDKYDDIRNGGEASEREINLLTKYAEKLERLDSLLCDIKELTKNQTE